MRLKRSGFIEKGKDGKLVKVDRQLAGPDLLRSIAVRKSHYQALDLARRSLDEDDISQTSFTAMTMAIDPSRIAEAHRRIRIFRRKLCAYLESGERKEVYRLSVQLFPLSRRENYTLKDKIAQTPRSRVRNSRIEETSAPT